MAIADENTLVVLECRSHNIGHPPKQNASRPALFILPQMAEIDIPQSMDATGEY
jgi:hypothetical protein